MKKTVKVVGAAIISEGKLLVAQRPHSEKAYKSLKWEFPGGKIEDGESKEDAIKREIKEELDCQIEVDYLLPEIKHEYPDFILEMTVCLCHLKGISLPTLKEHTALRWVLPNDLPLLDWAEADAKCYPMVTEWMERIYI